MDCTNYVGFMVAAVATGSVVLVTLQAHRRLASDVLRKLDEAIGAYDLENLFFSPSSSSVIFIRFLRVYG